MTTIQPAARLATMPPKRALAPTPPSASTAVAEAVTSPQRDGLTPLPKNDRMRRFFNPDYLSAEDKLRRSEQIRHAAETVRYSSTTGHQALQQQTGLTLDQARKLEQFAQTTNDRELIREAGFLVRMLTPPAGETPAARPGDRTTPTQYYSSAAQRACAAAVGRQAYQDGLRITDEAFVQRVIDTCGPGQERK